MSDPTQVIDDLETLLVRTILSKNAQQQFEQGDISHAELKPYAGALVDLSANYLSGGGARIESQIAAEAYALYYTPINFAKTQFMLSQLPNILQEKSLRVLDFGCGPGTASLALIGMGIKADIFAIDSSAHMRDLATKLLTGWTQLDFKVTERFEGRFDLIILGNVLNEMGRSSADSLLNTLAEALSPGGSIIILEPALKEQTKNAMHLRDSLLKNNQGLTPIFPCTHREPCPMLLQEPENWCHGTLRWEEPRLTRQLDELTGFNKHRIKFTGFIFQRDGAPMQGVRVLDGPHKNKRGMEVLVCGPGQYGRRMLGRAEAKGIKQFDILN